ncbi:glutathione hydrolase 7 isoform X1 [Latimeria chalumnae]|nr:PREDICTED: gamma-glutamyltransferase 7 [Latimeria chalumnae]|eukprot:XP_005986846.1 PREDICTED: gamma-glutamyltransferase 7 [Latimeria chalumnae]
MAEKEAGQETNLGAYSPVDYMSITSFPRLPEEDAVSGDHILRSSRKDEDAFLSEQENDPDSFLKSARLQRLPSSSSEMGSQDVSPLRETTKDPFAGDCSCRQDGLTVIITACLTFATGVTVALIIQIYFGDPQVFNQGAVVSDAAACSALGIRVLNKQGSSVDAAIVTALCSGIINPHTSGLGGGGVMLVHDIRRNESQVIDFRETAPSGVREDMFKDNWELKPGLLVGVPGMIRGLHHAHQLYGRLPWTELISLVAGIAREGFNVTHDLAKAVSNLKDKNVSEKFQKVFLPDNRPLLPGSILKREDLAEILDSIGEQGVSAFYSSNITQEMVSEVNDNGGVLSEEDFSNYSALIEKPVEGQYQGHLVLTPMPPHAGAGIIAALNILEGFNLTEQVPRNGTFHWITEALKIALAMASGLGDPYYNSTVSETLQEMLSKSEAAYLRQSISDTQSLPPGHSVPFYTMEMGLSASQVAVIGPDDFIVAVVSSLNCPFGSQIMTPSGILLNSQMLDFSWPNKTNSSFPNPKNNIQPGKRPLSFLLPTIVRPGQGFCGTYLSMGASDGDKALSGITQVLLNVLSFHKNLSESLSLGRLHPVLQPDLVQVDSEFLQEDIEFLEARDHTVERVDHLTLVHGARRINDLIIGVKDPRSMDAGSASIS